MHKTIKEKYLKDKRFFCSNARGGHSSGTVCMMLNTFVRVNSNMWRVMVKSPNFGMRFG
jgi:hypothetical protein